MKALLANLQGLAAAVAATILWFAMPRLIEMVNPTDAAPLPGGYAAAILLGLLIYLVGLAAAWIAYQSDFRRMDAALDTINPKGEKLCTLLLPFWLLLGWFGLAQWLAFRLLS